MKDTSKNLPHRSFRERLRELSEAELLALLEAGDEATQARACLQLGSRRAKKAVGALVRRLSSANSGLREAAAEALGRIGELTAGEPILALLLDVAQPETVRDTCAYALARLAYKPALYALLAKLFDPSETVRICAVAALASIAAPEARSYAELAQATETDARVREAIAGLLEILTKRSGEAVGLPAHYERARDHPMSLARQIEPFGQFPMKAVPSFGVSSRKVSQVSRSLRFTPFPRIDASRFSRIGNEDYLQAHGG